MAADSTMPEEDLRADLDQAIDLLGELLRDLELVQQEIERMRRAIAQQKFMQQ